MTEPVEPVEPDQPVAGQLVGVTCIDLGPGTANPDGTMTAPALNSAAIAVVNALVNPDQG